MKQRIWLITSLYCICGSLFAAVLPDRTRIIINESEKNAAITLTNQSSTQPYLAQSWIEDSNGVKNRDIIIALPPLQRMEPSEQVQVKLMQQVGAGQLPKDRETLLYYNVREIPPKPDTSNALQFALQSRLKVFYRPQAVELKDLNVIPYHSIGIERTGSQLQLINPTPYHIIVGYLGRDGKSLLPDTQSAIIAPFAKQQIALGSYKGSALQVGFISDHGGLILFEVTCASESPRCRTAAIKSGAK